MSTHAHTLRPPSDRLAVTHPQTFDHVWLVGCSSRVWGHELFLDVSRRAEDDARIHLVRRASPDALRGVSNNPSNGFYFGLPKGKIFFAQRLPLFRTTSGNEPLGALRRLSDVRTALFAQYK